MQARFLFAVGLVLFVGGSAALGQETYRLERFEYKASSLEPAVAEALEAFAAKAVENLLPKAQADDKQAYEKALAEIRQRARELVKYEVLDAPHERPGAAAIVALRGELSRADVEKVYAAHKKTAKSTRRFRIMVVISEEHRRERSEPIHVSHEVRPDSKIAAAIQSTLADAGYAVVNGNQIAELQRIQGDFATLDAKDAKIVQEIAARQKADLIVRGNSKADGPHPKVVEDRTMYQWFADATVTVFRSDDGNVLFSIPRLEGDGCRVGLNEVRDAGSSIALEKAGHCIAAEFLQRMTGFETLRSPEVKVTIQGLKEFTRADDIGQWFGTLAGVDAASHDWQRDILYITIKTALDSRELARAIEAWKDAGGAYRLKVTGASPNTVDVEYVPK